MKIYPLHQTSVQHIGQRCHISSNIDLLEYNAHIMAEAKQMTTTENTIESDNTPLWFTSHFSWEGFPGPDCAATIALWNCQLSRSLDV